MSALRFAVIGTPVGHSKSPAMHGAAYRALGLPHAYEKLETSGEDLPRRIAALRDGTFAGLNVTVPHKRAVLALVDDLDASARATGAGNTLVRLPDGKLRAYNTDAAGLREELAALVGDRARFAGASALVIGTGGAARAAVFALGELGVSEVVVRGRSEARDLVSVLAASNASARLVARGLDPDEPLPKRLVAIVQTTTAGMVGSDVPGEVAASAVDWSRVPDDAVAYDVVYVPPRTPFVERAEARGLRVASGLGMLVRQGALAFELWLGVAPPLDVMGAAL